MTCSSCASEFQGYPLTKSERDNFVGHATKAFGSAHFGFLGVTEADVRFGAVPMPSGGAANACLYAEDDKKPAGFFTEAAGAQIGVAVEKITDGLSVKAFLLVEGTVILHAEWTIIYGPRGAPNWAARVTDIKLVKGFDDPHTQGCFLNCVKRHGPKCIGVCTSWWIPWPVCAACVAAAAGCCLINCHC